MILTFILLAAFAILAWRDLKIALVLLIGLLPTYLIRFDVGPVPTTALEVMILTCVFVWVVRHHGWRIDPRSIGLDWLRPILLLLAAACFAVVIAPDTMAALGIWKAYFIEPVLVYLMLRAMFRDSADWQRALTALSISAIVISLGAIIQHFTGLGIPPPWDIENRATSLFDFPNAVGLFLAPLISAMIIIFFQPERSEGSLVQKILRRFTPQNGIFFGLIILGIITIIFSQTEAAIVAIPAGLLVTYLISSANKKNKLIVLISSMAVAAILFAAVPMVREKLLLQDTSGLARQNIWHETSLMLRDHPVFGAGLSGFPSAIEPYHDATFYEIFQYPHNIVLNIWVELGLLGLVAVGWLGWSVIKSVRSQSSDPIKLAVFAALATMVIHGLVDVPYFKNDLSVLTWFFLALLVASTSDALKGHQK